MPTKRHAHTLARKLTRFRHDLLSAQATGGVARVDGEIGLDGGGNDDGLRVGDELRPRLRNFLSTELRPDRLAEEKRDGREGGVIRLMSASNKICTPERNFKLLDNSLMMVS